MKLFVVGKWSVPGKTVGEEIPLICLESLP
jgi:hypothetical protein